MRLVILLLTDAFRESSDQKSLHLLIFFGLMLIVFFAGVSTEELPAIEVLAKQSEAYNVFRLHGTFGQGFTSTTQIDFRSLEVRPKDSTDSLLEERSDATVILLQFDKLHQFDSTSTNWKSFYARKVTGEWPKRTGDEPVPRYNWEDRLAVIRQRYEDMGYTHVDARLVKEDPFTVKIAVATDRVEEIAGAHRIFLFFGSVELPLAGTSKMRFVLDVQKGLCKSVLGLLGLLIFLSTCSTFVPNMLQQGSVDLLLARPIDRSSLLLAKTAAAILFTFLLILPMIVGAWIALGARTGEWNPWILSGLFTTTAMFALLHPVAVLVGVVARSTSLPSLFALCVWGGSIGIEHVHRSKSLLADYPFAQEVVAVARAVLPKLRDFETLNLRCLARGSASPQLIESVLGPSTDINWWLSLGSSALFSACVLALAVWIFRRKDW